MLDSGQLQNGERIVLLVVVERPERVMWRDTVTKVRVIPANPEHRNPNQQKIGIRYPIKTQNINARDGKETRHKMPILNAVAIS